jgi:kynurenine formamidase
LNARIQLGTSEVVVNLWRPISLAIELSFPGRQPRHFGAPAASAQPFAVEGFSGSVADGASCNCNVVTLIPHCNGTHTECVGHLTRGQLDAHRVVPLGLIPALLVTVEPVAAEATSESTDPSPQAGDMLVTRRSLENAWPSWPSGTSHTKPAAEPTVATAAALPVVPHALVIRTLPNGWDKRYRDYTNQSPPYLSRDAAELLVARKIRHLVVDLPSIDRTHDEGCLTAHRTFFGLAPEAREVGQAARPDATITELAYIQADVLDGPYMLELQVPALGGDAVPSRPLLYPLQPT